MQNSKVLSGIIILVLAFASEACQEVPTQNCDDLCFCPCRIPGGGEKDVISPSQDCLARIDCISTTLECTDEIMACQPEPEPEPVQNCDDLCFCPCRIPGGGEEDLILPSDDCLARIKCQFGATECSAQIMACQPEPEPELCFCPCRIPFCGPDALYYPSQSCLQRIRCQYGAAECSAEYINGSGK